MQLYGNRRVVRVSYPNVGYTEWWKTACDRGFPLTGCTAGMSAASIVNLLPLPAGKPAEIRLSAYMDGGRPA